jgi:hypothetical protein
VLLRITTVRTRLLIGAIVLAAASGAISSAGTDSRLKLSTGFLSIGGAERGVVSTIAGDAVTLEEARARVPYPIPLLKAVSLPQVCDEGDGPLRLLQSFSTYEDADPGTDQTALIYNHGVWVQLEPVADYRFGEVPELPSVEDAFPPDDYPEGLTTSTARGHVAWVNELDGPVTCPGPPDLTIWYTPGPECPNGMCTVGPPPQAPGAFSFAANEVALIKWFERGVIVEIGGPYSSEVLKTLAAGIQWPNQ